MFWYKVQFFHELGKQLRFTIILLSAQSLGHVPRALKV